MQQLSAVRKSNPQQSLQSRTHELADLMLLFLYIVKIDVITWLGYHKDDNKIDSQVKTHVRSVYYRFKDHLCALMQHYAIPCDMVSFSDVFFRAGCWFQDTTGLFPYVWVQDAFREPEKPFGDTELKLSGKEMLTFFKPALKTQCMVKQQLKTMHTNVRGSFKDFMLLKDVCFLD